LLEICAKLLLIRLMILRNNGYVIVLICRVCIFDNDDFLLIDFHGTVLVICNLLSFDLG